MDLRDGVATDGSLRAVANRNENVSQPIEMSLLNFTVTELDSSLQPSFTEDFSRDNVMLTLCIALLSCFLFLQRVVVRRDYGVSSRVRRGRHAALRGPRQALTTPGAQGSSLLFCVAKPNCYALFFSFLLRSHAFMSSYALYRCIELWLRGAAARGRGDVPRAERARLEAAAAQEGARALRQARKRLLPLRHGPRCPALYPRPARPRHAPRAAQHGRSRR